MLLIQLIGTGGLEMIIRRLRRGYAITLFCLLFVRSVILSVYEQNYCKSNQPISLKLGVMFGPTIRKNWFTFGSDPVPRTIVIISGLHHQTYKVRRVRAHPL